MGSDAWAEALVADELPAPTACGGQLTKGSACRLRRRVDRRRAGADPSRWASTRPCGDAASRARAVGARGGRCARPGRVRCSLEVRAGNVGAQELYAALGFRSLGVRPRYYSDGGAPSSWEEPSAVGQARCGRHGAGGGRCQRRCPSLRDEVQTDVSRETSERRPSSLAIRIVLRRTAAAIVDGNGTLIAGVVASQIDFHARFGGVVPEIASRKALSRAICGVCDECFDVAASALGIRTSDLARSGFHCRDVRAGARGVALVVGVAFAKSRVGGWQSRSSA